MVEDSRFMTLRRSTPCFSARTMDSEMASILAYLFTSLLSIINHKIPRDMIMIDSNVNEAGSRKEGRKSPR